MSMDNNDTRNHKSRSVKNALLQLNWRRASNYSNMQSKNKILLVQFRTDNSIINEQKNILKLLKKRQLIIVNAFDKKTDFSCPKKITKNINKIILGGSGEFYLSDDKNIINKIEPLIKYILKKDIPTLGICFGHQLLGHMLGTQVIQDNKQEEVGSFHISLTPDGKKSNLFIGLPKTFIAQLGHKDSLEKLPKNTILLAKSKKCRVQAFCYKKNIYGVQFHPELTRTDVIKKIKLYPEYIVDGNIKKAISKLKPSPYASLILKNFINLTL